MATIAQLIGAGIRKGIGAIPGVDLPSEKRQRVLSSAFGTEFDQDVAGGMDIGEAQIRALSRAAAGFAAEGMIDQATELRMKLVELVKAEEERQARLDQLRADTEHTRVSTISMLSPDPKEPKDELIRMQQQRELLLARFQANPDNELLAEELDEINSRIDKLVTITGRTPEDVAATSPTQKTLNDLQKAFLDTVPRLDGLRKMRASFRPEFVTVPGKLVKAWYSAKEIAGFELTPEQKQRLAAQSTFNQNVVREMNDYIRSITGATINNQEAPRLIAGMPNQDDGPVQFQAKLDNTLAYLEAAQRRLLAALRAGDITIMAQPLENFLELDLANFDINNATPEQVDAVIRQLTR